MRAALTHAAYKRRLPADLRTGVVVAPLAAAAQAYKAPRVGSASANQRQRLFDGRVLTGLGHVRGRQTAS
jgi:hypothetical protein